MEIVEKVYKTPIYIRTCQARHVEKMKKEDLEGYNNYRNEVSKKRYQKVKKEKKEINDVILSLMLINIL